MASDSDPTVLQLPATMRNLRTVRLVAAACADDAGFDFEGVEDIRLTVDELCALVIEGAQTDSQLEVRFEARPGEVAVSGHCAMPDGAPAPELPRLSAEILAAVADDHELAVRDGQCHFRFTKRQLPE
ncbi:MAG: ATP-binding protein [Acidimicrobiia bacterium]